MKYIARPPCKTCPFRKDSLQGYLGPETVESIEKVVHGEGLGWSCHESIAGKPTMTDGKVDVRKYGTACTGAILSATKSCKSYREGPLADLQRTMRGHKSTSDILNAWEFRAYHGPLTNPMVRPKVKTKPVKTRSIPGKD